MVGIQFAELVGQQRILFFCSDPRVRIIIIRFTGGKFENKKIINYCVPAVIICDAHRYIYRMIHQTC